MKKNIFISSIIVGLIVILFFYSNASVVKTGTSIWQWYKNASLDVAPVNNELYKSQCGECHFVYQPGLLPSKKWKKIMVGLADHFGDDAELMPEDYPIIMNYLTKNAAEFSNYKLSRKIRNSLRGGTSLRITDTPYFKRKHGRFSDRIFNSKKIGSKSNCIACHTQAETGSFREGIISLDDLKI